MGNAKNEEQKKRRVAKRGLCGCLDDGVINCTVPQSSRKYDVGSVKEDVEGLMRILAGGGAMVDVDVDAEGNLVWRKQAMETSYGDGVGRIGRIDEDKPCCFREVDVNKFRYFATNSKRLNLAYT